MKTYNSQIENGIKTALYGLQALMENENIVNNQLLAITGQLESLVDQAQQGLIEHAISHENIITEQHLDKARKSHSDENQIAWSLI